MSNPIQSERFSSSKETATILVTGGAGFIGANFILQARAGKWYNVVNLDKLTYDRPGHDRRYAIDCSKITRELG